MRTGRAKYSLPSESSENSPKTDNLIRLLTDNLEQTQTSKQPNLWLPEPVEINEDGGNWLSPLVVNAIPFEGREDECALLTQFATTAPPSLKSGLFLVHQEQVKHGW